MKSAYHIFFLLILSLSMSVAKDFDASVVNWPDIVVDTAGNAHVVMLQYKTSDSMYTGYRIIHYRQLDENNWDKIVVYDKNIEPTSNFCAGKLSLYYGDGFLHLVYAQRSYSNDAWRAVYYTYPVLTQPAYWVHKDTIMTLYDNKLNATCATACPFQYDICFGAAPSFIQTAPGVKCPHVALYVFDNPERKLFYYFNCSNIDGLYLISEDAYGSNLIDGLSIYVPLETYDRLSIYYISEDRHDIKMATLAGVGPSGPFWASEVIITEDDPFIIDGISSMEIPLYHPYKNVYYTTYNGGYRYLKYKYYNIDNPEQGWHSQQDYIDMGLVRYISNSSNYLVEDSSGHILFGVVYEKGGEGEHEIRYAISFEDLVDFWHFHYLLDDSNVLGQSPKSDRFGLDVVYLISGAYGSTTRYTKVDLDKKAREEKIPESKGISVSGTILHVYPNPARETVTILIEPRDYTRVVSMYDLAGRLCSSVEVAPGTRIFGFNVSDFPSGCYVLTCNDPNSTRCTAPLVIAH